MSSRSKKLQVHSVAANILYSIGDSTDDVIYPRGIGGASMHGGRRKYQSQFHAIERLRKAKLIHVKKRRDVVVCSLSQEGWNEYFRLKILKTELLPAGKICIVVFDIPEKQRALRRWLRRLLDHAGFLPLQKSVWISPFDAIELILVFSKRVKINNFVRVFTAEEQTMTRKVRSDLLRHSKPTN